MSLPTYDPADDLPPEYEPEDGEHFHEPDLTDEEQARYEAWAATQPRRTVAHICGHTHEYLDSGGLRVHSAENPCLDCMFGDLPPYDDPFKE